MLGFSSQPYVPNVGVQHAFGQRAAAVPPPVRVPVPVAEVLPLVQVPAADQRPRSPQAPVQPPAKAPAPEVVDLIELSDEGKPSPVGSNEQKPTANHLFLAGQHRMTVQQIIQNDN
jgi:hypothetical protein